MAVNLKIFRHFLVVIVFLWISQSSFAQFNIPKKPLKETSVYDFANLLSDSQKTSLEQKLIHYSDSTSTQIVVATVNNIAGEEISIIGANWAHSWGIGQEKKDNGIFILLAKNERRITIQTGYGIEHLLTDAFSRRIIENVIIPEFKKGDYYVGLDKGTDVIFDILTGEYKNNNSGSSKEGEIPAFLIILIVFFILMIIFSKKNRGGGNGGRGYRKDSTAAAILEAIILSGAGRSSGSFGGGGFGSSGGGFGSGGFGGGFGGGGFGGGGASGGW